MIKPICVPCQRFFRPARNGVHVLEQKPRHGVQQPKGTEAPEMWEPYKVWHADRWECLGCGASIIIGSGRNPLWEDCRGPNPFHIDHTVNDC